MTTIYCPKDHVGPYTFPEGCVNAWVDNCPLVTEITFPEGCVNPWVYSCPLVTEITFPEDCVDPLVYNCPLYNPDKEQA